MRKQVGGAIAAVLVLGAASAVSVGSQVTGTTLAAADSPGEFTYNGGAGPGLWADVLPADVRCGVGTSHSTIDIGRVNVDATLQPLQLALEPTPSSLINNGHAIEEEIEAPNTPSLNGDVYASSQYHCH